MRILRPGYRRSHWRQGVGFIWFTLVALPALLLAMAFSADFTRIIMTGHAMSNATNAAAIAGAWEFQPGTVVLDKSAAERAAVATFCRAQATVPGQEALPRRAARRGCPDPVAVTVDFADYNAHSETSPGYGYRTVSVTAHYRVTGTIFFAYFGGGDGFDAPPTTHAASVCVPGDDGNYTGGHCARPLITD